MILILLQHCHYDLRRRGTNMTNAFDGRLVKLTIDFGKGEVLTFDQNAAITASGKKYLGNLMNECEVKIFNLTPEHRNYILTRTSPMMVKIQPVNISLEVGRESYGTFQLFSGNVSVSAATQPPDIGVVMTCFTSFATNYKVVSINQPAISQLSTIAAKVASEAGLTLLFKATDKQIYNYSYNGSARQQCRKLNQMGGIVAFINNGVLAVVNADEGAGDFIRKINMNSGMVGIPQITQKGVTVRMMIDNTVDIGSKVEVESKIVPSADGQFLVQGLLFDIASREQPFFYTLECFAEQYTYGTLG